MWMRGVWTTLFRKSQDCGNIIYTWCWPLASCWLYSSRILKVWPIAETTSLTHQAQAIWRTGRQRNMQNTLHLAAPTSVNLQTNSMLAATWWDRNGKILHPTIGSFVFQNTLPPARTPRCWCGIGQLQAMPSQALTTVQVLFRHQHIPWGGEKKALNARHHKIIGVGESQGSPERSLPLTSTVGLLRLEISSTRYSAAQLAARAYSSTYMNAKALDEVLLQTLVGQIDTQLFKGVSSGCQKEQYIIYQKTSKNRW